MLTLFQNKIQTLFGRGANKVATLDDVNSLINQINRNESSKVTVVYRLSVGSVNEAVPIHISGGDGESNYPSSDCKCELRNRQFWRYTNGQIGCINCRYAYNLALMIVKGGQLRMALPPVPTTPPDTNPPIQSFTVRLANTLGGGTINTTVEKSADDPNAFDIYTYDIATNTLVNGYADGIEVIVDYYIGTYAEGSV